MLNNFPKFHVRENFFWFDIWSDDSHTIKKGLCKLTITQTAKTTANRRIAVRETGVSPDHEGLIKGPPEILVHHSTIVLGGFQEGPKLGPHYAVSRTTLSQIADVLAVWTITVLHHIRVISNKDMYLLFSQRTQQCQANLQLLLLPVHPSGTHVFTIAVAS